MKREKYNGKKPSVKEGQDGQKKKTSLKRMTL
jgi:hypothetical protein